MRRGWPLANRYNFCKENNGDKYSASILEILAFDNVIELQKNKSIDNKGSYKNFFSSLLFSPF